MHKKTKIILAAVAGIELVVFAVMFLIIWLKEYQLDEWFALMGVVGVSGIFLAARAENRNPKNQ
ncbi:MAG: hypothetical protein AAF927_01795 [Bacteroidota bacterium]